MKRINNCSLVCVDCYNHGKAINSLQKSMAQNEFDKVLFLTDSDIQIDGVKTIVIPRISSIKEYSHFVVKELWKYITTDFVLHVQHDSWTLNGDLFDERLYEYDWAGALWLESDGFANGNGGYSWKSRKLLEAVGNDELIFATHPEDAQLCRTYRGYLEKAYGLKWAPDEICEGFAFELREPRQPTMGFHSFFHQPYKPTVILKRSGAVGDIILMEPAMRHYHDAGYNVVVDIPMDCYDLFVQHYYPVKHISQFDRGRIRPEKEINLDLAYEVTPFRNYVQSYFEMCGIKEKPKFKPYLFPFVNEQTKLFKKYCIVHIDNRQTPHRNIYGVNWGIIERYLISKGYLVIQVGKGEHENIGIQMNTATLGFLKFLIAGADLMISVDSGPSHIAVAHNIPSVIAFGSVNPDFIHLDLSKVVPLQGKCDKQNCWHHTGATAGQECFYKGTDKYLQCCKLDAYEIIDGINKITG